jgi:transposase
VKNIRFVGLDVHAESIAVAVAEAGGEVRSLGVIPNQESAVRRLVRRLGKKEDLRVCYEAGPTGYVVYWWLQRLGVHCDVVAPTLVPVRAGDRVKTDRRDALKLARCYRAGDLTPVWVPDAAHEALRDLVRAREAAKKDQLRIRHRLQKYLLRRGARPPEGARSWGAAHRRWLLTVRFQHPAQNTVMLEYLGEVEHVEERLRRLDQAIQDTIATAPEHLRQLVAGLAAMRGIARPAAAMIAVELGPASRFAKPRQLMGYAGLVSAEHSSGGTVRRGAITKTGNAHLRRILIEAAWAYRHRPGIGIELAKRQKGISLAVREIALKAQHRLHRKYVRLASRGKPHQQVVTAVARELLGFVWAVGVQVEHELPLEKAA